MKNVRSTKHDSNVWRHWTPNSIPDSGHFWNQNIDVWTWITVFSLAVIKKPTAPWDSAHQDVPSGVIKTELDFSLHRHFNNNHRYYLGAIFLCTFLSLFFFFTWFRLSLFVFLHVTFILFRFCFLWLQEKRQSLLWLRGFTRLRGFMVDFYKTKLKSSYYTVWPNIVKWLLRKSPNRGMDLNFDVSASPPFVTGFSNVLKSLNIKLLAVVADKTVFVSCVFVLLIMN